MAGSIKGIIVEIGGDTSGLQKALSKVNSATSSLSKELRGVNSLLKLDPKNTELVSEKQILLAQRINKTEEKLKTLKQTQEEAEKAIQDGTEVSQENYRALQQEIIRTEQKLKEFKLEASKWTTAGKAIENFGSKIDNIGSKIDRLGGKLTARVTTPLIALGVVGTKSAMEQEAAMQQVDLIYGDASKTIKDFAENTAVSFNMSTKDAYKYSQIYGNLIQSITDDTKENATYTQQLLKASSVIASATGRTMEDVMDRIRSGLLGNTEAIEDLGVNVNVSLLESTDAFKKFAGDKSWKQLDFQTQQQIRLFGILEQTTKKYGSTVNQNTASSVQKLSAKFNNLTSKLTKKLLPIANKLIDTAEKFIDKLDDLSDKEQENIIKTGLMVIAIGPLLKIVGLLTSTVGKGIKAVGIFSQAIGVLKTGAKSTSSTVNNLAKVIGAIASPAGLAAIGITTAVAIIVAQMKKAEEQSKKAFETIGNSASDFMSGIDSATSHLGSFNSTLFATSEEQQKLQEQMDKIQKGITSICKTASDGRRGYTKKEIKQLDEYFNKLRELKDREIEIQNSVAQAISQQAMTNAETFKGGLNEYRVQAQEWIKTAQEQRDATISIIKDGTTQEIALLNQRYGSEANMQNQAYVAEYNKIMEQQQSKIDMANQEVAKVNEVYANGYLERAKQDDGFYNSIKEHLSNIENEQGRHNRRIKELADTKQTAWNDVNGAIRQEGREHDSNMKKIYDNMYKNMSEEQAKELGIWLAQVAQTEMYGGKISEETQKTVDAIMDSYDTMPKDTKKVMQDSMQGMLNGMKDNEPTLFAKATSIANGILSRLKKAFDIHSPSKETRKIFDYVMKGAEKGLEDEERKLYKQTDNISKKLLGKFEGIGSNLNLGNLNKSVIEQTKTVFTTPQITFNIQELDEARLQQCFNYINRKFGSAY